MGPSPLAQKAAGFPRVARSAKATRYQVNTGKTSPHVSRSVSEPNSFTDRDKDGTACEPDSQRYAPPRTVSIRSRSVGFEFASVRRTMAKRILYAKYSN